MLSMRLTAAMIVLALLTAPALGLLADRNVETSVLLAGLAAILGVLMVAVLSADTLTRPLVEMADAVQALARDKSAQPNHESDERHDNVVALQPHAQRMRMVIATVELAGRPKALGGAIATGNPAAERRCKLTTAHAVGNYVDIAIHFDGREGILLRRSRNHEREDVTR
jgi:hypothetical protein